PSSSSSSNTINHHHGKAASNQKKMRNGSRSRTKPAWPAKRPKLNEDESGGSAAEKEEFENGDDATSQQQQNPKNQRPQRRSRPDYLGVDLHLNEVRQVQKAIAASLKEQRQ